ncbi:GNAT family N-acetyltransferase [Marinivivus vitaminiproducens]|uniref:GNAT family N-acetyltransferase n=1 Tax=Marinivivus vitaminiproducens TaxID=3035935 RepID=UPI0027A29838|nr:GNAT family N-acyltransferase [Geminicoccaceae bacterium SCSIO 64248]
MSDIRIPAPGRLEVRLARSSSEVRAAQRLRYRIFYEEMGARAEAGLALDRIDRDEHDALCDHLLVLDHGSSARPAVVGTYRLLRGDAGGRQPCFYSAAEFDLAPLLRRGGRVLELGRSCVDPRYRNGPVMQLLWQGIASYVLRHDIDVLFGCASLPGTDVKALRHPLAFLHHDYRAPTGLRPRAVTARAVAMDRLPSDAVDRTRAWRELPPLVRGYLRAGARVGDGAVIDWDFGTTDVCMIVETTAIAERCRQHDVEAPRHALMA